MKKFKTVEKFWLGKKYFIRDAENNVLAVFTDSFKLYDGKDGLERYSWEIDDGYGRDHYSRQRIAELVKMTRIRARFRNTPTNEIPERYKNCFSS